MIAISAADAVSPAIQRTRDFLFRPFSWGTFLKLGLVAVITEGIGSNFHSSSQNGHPSGHGPVINSPFDIPPGVIAAIVAAVLLAFLVSILVFYLVTRLRFAYFHCLIHNSREIAPGWRLYSAQAGRFFWLNLAVGFCFLLVMALIAIPFITGFVRLFHDTPPGGAPNFGLLAALILPLIPIILLLVLAGIVSDVILRDWMLPHYALGNATAGEAWSRVWAHFQAEKKQFIVYTLLRVVLPTVAVVCIFMVLAIPGIFLAGAMAVFGYGLHSAFADSTGASAVAGILIQAFFAVIGFGFFVLAGICLGGPVSTGVREYALIFYGGRYPALGEILHPSPIPPSGSAATRLA